MWLEHFNQMRKESGMSLDELCVKAAVPKGTLTKITSGVTKAPSLDTMRSLVHAMGYTLDELENGIGANDAFTKEERAHIKKYRVLDRHGKEAVDGILDIEHRRCLEELRRVRDVRSTEESDEIGAESALYYFPMYDTPMSAGTGQAAGQGYPENVRLIKEPPRGASYIAPVSGNSMEPTYQNGDLLFIRAAQEIEPGQIGVFLMDGQQWVKELGHGELISHNTGYSPIKMNGSIQCQGLVLGVCDDSYFE